MSVVDATTADLSIYPIHPSIYLYLPKVYIPTVPYNITCRDCRFRSWVSKKKKKGKVPPIHTPKVPTHTVCSFDKQTQFPPHTLW